MHKNEIETINELLKQNFSEEGNYQYSKISVLFLIQGLFKGSELEMTYERGLLEIVKIKLFESRTSS